MAKSILNYLKEIQKVGIRTTNAFELQLSTGIPEVDSILANITMFGQGFQIPSRTQNFADVSFRGYPIPIPTNMEMEREHSITINADVAGDIRRGFLLWQSYVTDPAIGDGSLFGGDKRPPANSYARILLLGNDMETITETYRLVGVSVASVGNMQVSNNDSSVATFDVQLKSVYWEIENHISPVADVR